MVTLLTCILTICETIEYLEKGTGDLQAPTSILHGIDRLKHLTEYSNSKHIENNAL